MLSLEVKRLDTLKACRYLMLLVMLLMLCSCKTTPSVDVARLVQSNQESWLKEIMEEGERNRTRSLLLFGDSLSDTGRLHDRTRIFYPADVYWHSRASNGPIWIDYIARASGWDVMNYAVAGAATNSPSWWMSLFVSALQEQVKSFLASDDDHDKKGMLAVIWIGPNNYLPDPSHADVTAAIRDIEQAVTDLRKGGLKNFLLGSMPELSGLPSFRGSRVQNDILKALTQAHNKALKELLEKLRRRDSAAEYNLFQAFEINQSTLERPADYGFTNMTDACYKGDFRGNFEGPRAFCQNPSRHKFWDAVHPTSKMHCYYAAQFLADLQATGFFPSYRRADGLRQCRKLDE